MTPEERQRRGGLIGGLTGVFVSLGLIAWMMLTIHH